MTEIKVGIQIHPQATSLEEMRAAWRVADELGADSIWIWDHFYPLYGDPDATHFEGWALLAAMATDTKRAMIGTLVTGNNYRNPELLADMARTVDHISGGRTYLGVGAGWFERDYEEYGYEFGTAGSRLAQLGEDLPRMKSRLGKLNPGPAGDLPILIGGGGEKVTLRLVAEFADSWNTFGPPDNFAHKSAVLDQWCEKVGRDPSEVERTVAISSDEIDNMAEYAEVGASHMIIMAGAPFDMGPLEAALGKRDSLWPT